MKHWITLAGLLLLCTGSINAQAQEGFLEYNMEHSDQNFYLTKAEMDAYYADKDKGRGTGYSHYMRWHMNTEKYVYPSGEMFNVSARLAAEYNRFAKTLPSMQSRATHGYWESEGPTSYTLGWGWNGGNGRVNSISFNPSFPTIIYLGTPAGGLWTSYNSGTTWEAQTDGLPSIGMSGLAVNYNNVNIMYLLTGDGDAAHTSSIGVLKSTNGGATWLPTDLSYSATSGVRGYKLLMHPTNPNILFVAASNGIWKTVNGGADWTQEHTAWFTDIEFKPGTPATMYAVSTTNFYRSANTGDSWTIDNDTDFPSSWCRMAIAVTPANVNYVYLLFGGHVSGTGNGQFSGIFRSTNSGVDFSLRANTPNLLGYSSTGQDSVNQGCYDLALAVDPSNANTVYVGGINVWKSTNGGANWTISSHWYEQGNTIGYTHADIHALEFSGSTLYCGSDGGIFRTTDGGSNWTDLSSGLANMQFYYLDVESNIFAGGTQDNGCNQWTSSTNNCTHSIGADGFACLINYSNTNIRYQSDQDAKWRSTNGGASFTDISVSGVASYWDADWIMDPVDPQRLFLAQQDIWRTTTGGTGGSPWTDLNCGFTGTRLIRSMAQGISNTNRFYASNDVAFRRSDNVLAATPTWADKTTGLPVGSALISDIAVDPANSLRVWVSFYGLSNGNKVFYTNNGGDNWFNESGSLPNIPVNCIIYEPGSGDGLYVGTDFGVFYRNDDIGDWIFYGNGLPNTRVFDLDIEGSRLYAATFARGLWSTALFSCDANLVLTQANDPSSPDFTGQQMYHASNSIVSSRIITGGLGTDVLYGAASVITLTEGFHAKQDNIFEVKLEGCPD